MVVGRTFKDYLLGNACVMNQRWKMRHQGVWERNKQGRRDMGIGSEYFVDNWAGHCVHVAMSCACEHSLFCILIIIPF